MNIDELLEIIDLTKTLKCAYIVTHGNIIMGSDENYVYLKRMTVDRQLPTMAVGSSTLQSIVKEPSIYNTVNLYNHDIFNRIHNMFFTISDMIQAIPPLELKKIDEELDFMEAIGMKTGQGIKYIRRDKFFIPIYNGLLPLVKGDKVDVSLYDLNNNYSFLSKFNIHKKKKMMLEVYLLCMHMK